MQVAASLQGNDAVAVETKLLAKISGVARQPLAVIAGVRVAGLHAQSQRHQHGLSILQFVSELLKFQQRFDAREKLLRIKRLAEKIIGASFNPAHAVVARSKTGNHDHRNQSRERIVLELAAKVI